MPHALTIVWLKPSRSQEHHKVLSLLILVVSDVNCLGYLEPTVCTTQCLAGWMKDDKKAKKGPARSPSCQLVYDFKKILKASRKLRDSHDMIQYQLVEMHDR